VLTKNEIISDLWKSKFIDDLIWTITSGNKLKDDLKSELFLILCEFSDARIQHAWNNNYINYLCINILKKQYHSKTSKFHKLFRKGGEEMTDMFPTIVDEVEGDDRDLIVKIEFIIQEKLDLIDRELFKMYFKIGRYDRWLGDLRDTTCQKPVSSLRKISKKLEIISLEGRKVSISKDTIKLSLDRSMMIIRKQLVEYGDSNLNS
jgi:hypothetical protein